MTEEPDDRYNWVAAGGWCAPSLSRCPKCGGEICTCFAWAPPPCIGDCGSECVGKCFLEESGQP